MILVHLKKQRIKIREVEIVALGSMNEGNSKALESLLGSDRRLVVPGVKERTPQEDFEDKAKRMIAKEAKKVYAVRVPRVGTKTERAKLKQAAQSGIPEVATMARKSLLKQAQADSARNMGKKKAELPEGTVLFGLGEEDNKEDS